MTFPFRVAIASATRTAVGRAVKGALKDTRPEDMAAAVMQAAVAQVPGLTPADVEDVILGCAMPEAEQGLNLARNSIFAAGWPDSVPGEVVNRFCSSGLQAMAHAAQGIATGNFEVILAGGVESMSMVPMAGNKVSLHARLIDTRPEVYIAMGHTAERVAKRFGISRLAQDTFAAASHAKAVAAHRAGYLKAQITPMQARTWVNGQLTSRVFDVDECPRPDTSVAELAKLRPAFSAKGSVTAGNSSPLSDGAAATVLLSDRRMAELGVKPLGYMCGFAVVGVPPDIMGIGPLPAIQKLLRITGLTVADIDLFEINEAFAAQAVYCQQQLGIADDRLNVNGGGISLGHPLGCTGTKLPTDALHELRRRKKLTTDALHELRRRKKRFAVVSMCIGGGMGAAGLFEAA